VDDHQYWAAQVKNLVDLLIGWAWPVVLLILVLTFRTQVRALLGRLREGEGFGTKWKFDPAAAEPAVALAATTAAASANAAVASGKAFDATVRVRESVARKYEGVAREHPALAVTGAYTEIEKALQTLLRQANVEGVDRLAGLRLTEAAVRAEIISPATADALRRLRSLRNVAAHGGEVTVDEALDYLALCDQVLFAIDLDARR
jgi:hypothetical protein